MVLENWQILHREVIVDFLHFLFSRSNRFILKGGTSLMLCYNLSRFSEDIDLDGMDKSFFKYVDLFVRSIKMKYPNISYRKGKDTDTVKRAFIHYGGKKPLKIEVSYRRGRINPQEITCANGVQVYTLSAILAQKISAFIGRDKIRDLYDIVFIYTNYKGYLSNSLICSLRDAVGYKGLGQFDYLIGSQSDPLIDNNILMEGFLQMYYDLGLS